MKRISTTFIMLFVTCISFAQVNWVYSYDVARAISLSENKFIVMDFWADWCGPCRTMDTKMWNKSEMNALSDKFVFLKIDVDDNKSIAMEYRATSIPKVIIIDALGNKIWEQIGFRSADPFMKIFNEFPEADQPIDHMKKILNEEDDLNTKIAMGMAYQDLGKVSESNYISKGFLGLSDMYLKEVNKKSDNEALALEAEFNLILNNAYRGLHKKAIKKVEKMDEAEMKNFILAYCYKCEGQTEKMNEFVKKIQSQELIAELKN